MPRRSKKLTVAIIIPVYNEELFLEACLRSIQAQTVAPDEVIVVDNNSSDRSLQIARSFKGVKVISEKRQKVLYARTTGFNAATSDILGRIDADTRLEPDWVERLIVDFQDPDLAAVTGSSHWYDMPFSSWNHRVENFAKEFLFRHEKNFPFLFGTNMALRASAWHSISGQLCQDGYIFEDADLAIHLFQDGQKLLYDKKLRAGMSGRRGSDSPKQFLRYIRLQKLVYEKHGIRTIGSYISIAGYILLYVIVWPFALAYDHQANRLSLKKLFTRPNPARPHPFD